MPRRDAVLEAPLRHVYKPLPHDSGAKHVQGSAEYIDDMPVADWWILLLLVVEQM